MGRREGGWEELVLGAETWSAHLIRWVFHLLHVPPNHILRVLTCRDGGGTCLRRGEVGGVKHWGAGGAVAGRGGEGKLRVSRGRCLLGPKSTGIVIGVTRGLLFLRCFFLVLRHTPGTPGTGFTSLLLTGGGCRMGFGARVRHTGSPAAHSRIPVIPGVGGGV